MDTQRARAGHTFKTEDAMRRELSAAGHTGPGAPSMAFGYPRGIKGVSALAELLRHATKKQTQGGQDAGSAREPETKP